MLAALFAAGVGATPASACAPADPAPVANTLRTLYAAAMSGDAAGMQAVFAPGFYAFDGGRRFDGAGMVALVKGVQANGRTAVWTVNDPDVHITCNTARIAYVNRGAFTDASGTTPITWLESADLVFEGGRWRIAFFHSTRAGPPPPAKP